jgi:endonuclease III
VDRKLVKKGSAGTTTKSVGSKKAPGTAGKDPQPKGRKQKLAGKKTSKSKAAELTLVSPAVANKEMDALCKLYPDADCELDFKSEFQLLTAVILSAQTTDVQVNKVTPKLFARFPTAQALAEADIEEVKELIRATGYYNAKAQSIQRCAQALVEKHGGKVPSTIDELTALPGVGRKTANVVLGVAFGVPGWTVDTHVQRLSKRMGFTRNDDPAKIEVVLQKLFPKKDWSKLSITIIWHGRRMCFARKPNCPQCPINDLCPASEV